MNRAVDLTGTRLGMLSVVEITQRNPIKWKCVCDCGEIRYLTASVLLSKSKPKKSCGCHIMSKTVVEIGRVFETKSCGNIEIVGKVDNRKYLCRFDDETIVEALDGNIRSGNVANPCKRVVYGIGYHGVGSYRAHGEKSHAYWYKMMQRAYCPDYKEDHPTYEEVVVCEERHNFQNFAEWCCLRKQYGLFGFNLDKDLVKAGNKIYCPEYCSLVPQEINKLTVRKSEKRNLPQGVTESGDKFIARCRSNEKETYLGIFACPEMAGQVYRDFKKKTIIETANRFKESLDDNVYESLLNFEVER